MLTRLQGESASLDADLSAWALFVFIILLRNLFWAFGRQCNTAIFLGVVAAHSTWCWKKKQLVNHQFYSQRHSARINNDLKSCANLISFVDYFLDVSRSQYSCLKNAQAFEHITRRNRLVIDQERAMPSGQNVLYVFLIIEYTVNVRKAVPSQFFKSSRLLTFHKSLRWTYIFYDPQDNTFNALPTFNKLTPKNVHTVHHVLYIWAVFWRDP